MDYVGKAFQLTLDFKTYLQMSSNRKFTFKAKEQFKQSFEINVKPNTATKDVKDSHHNKILKGSNILSAIVMANFVYQFPTRNLFTDEVHIDDLDEHVMRLSMSLKEIVGRW